MSFRLKISAKFFFEVAHRMPSFPDGHPNARLHGHTYLAKVVLEGEVNPRTGMLMEYGELTKVLREVKEKIDHRYLNEIPGLEVPSSENIARWLWNDIATKIPSLYEIVIERPGMEMEVTYSGRHL